MGLFSKSDHEFGYFHCIRLEAPFKKMSSQTK